MMEIEEAIASLLEESQQQSTFSKEILRLEREVEPGSILLWLHSHNSLYKAYWKSREGDVERGALDCCNFFHSEFPTLAESLELVEHSLANQPSGELSYYFLSSFNLTSSLFYLPRWELIRREEHYLLALQFHGNESSFVSPPLKKREPPALIEPNIHSFSQIPTRKQWKEQFRKIKRLFFSRVLQKIVLSQKSSYTLSEEISGLSILLQMQEEMPGCYHFFLKIKPHSLSLFGFSPERLFLRKENEFYTEALAGTAWKKSTLHDAKFLEEYHYVPRFIIEKIRPLSEKTTMAENPSIYSLPYAHHLYCPIRAVLAPDISNYTLLTTLHPTPAVGGYKQRAALKEIPRIERHSRKYYAGLFGILQKSQTEFLVTIRSAHIEKNEISYFTGVGLTETSDEEAEWIELQRKREGILFPTLSSSSAFK